MNLNKILLIGNLTKDIVLRSTNTGKAVASGSMVTNHSYTDKAGVKQESSQFHNIVAWGNRAEKIANLKKGEKVFVEGRSSTRSYTNKDGIKKYVTEVVVDNVEYSSIQNGTLAGTLIDKYPYLTQLGLKGLEEINTDEISFDNETNQKDAEEEIPEINLDDNDEAIDIDKISF